MSEIIYVTTTWTAGDIITEAKMDNMTANDRAVDAMNNGIEFLERASPSTPGANKIHLYAKDKAGIPTLYAINDAATNYEISENTPTFVFTVQDILATGTSMSAVLIVPKALTITKVYGCVKTAPTGANLVIDINKNGSSIWNSTQANRLTILAGATSGNQTSFDVTTLAEADILTIDIDTVGSTIAGANLTVALKTK